MNTCRWAVSGVRVLLVVLVLFCASCTPYGHWGNYSYWLSDCPGFPTVEEVESVLEEQKDLVEELREEGLIWSADMSECPQGAFVTFLHGGEWQKARVLEILDKAGARAEGLNRFFGVPFRFLNV